MKKTILSAVLLSGLVLSASTTLAADAPSVQESKVEVQLEKDKGHEEGDGPFLDKLAIVYYPDVFTFKGKTTTGSLELKNTREPAATQFMAVNDDRKDENGDVTSSKWQLTGKLSDLTMTSDASRNLAANMVFTPSALKQYDIGTNIQTDANGKKDIVPNEITLESQEGAKAAGDSYNLPATFTLAAGGDEVVAFSKTAEDATDPHGVATNLGNVNLTVATGNAVDANAGNYNGTIVWTLTAQ